MEKLIEDYKKAFKEEPYIIGMFWDDNKALLKNIEKAIETNTPYNEYELLSKEEQKAFNNGELLF